MVVTIIRIVGCYLLFIGLANAETGFYRMKLGEFEVIALNDGLIEYSVADVLPAATSEQIANTLRKSGAPDPFQMSYNAFLIDTGNKVVLIDTGTGGKLDDVREFHGAGRLLKNLQAAGYHPEDIDEVYITHRGPDHIGGLTTGSARSFPNAIVRAPKNEFDIFLDPEKSEALLAETPNYEQAKAWLEFTKGLFEPYIKAGKFQSIEEDGIRTA